MGGLAPDHFAALKAEVDAESISRYDKSLMRDALIALKQYKGTPRDVQSQLETQCMNYKRMRGIPTFSPNFDIARNFSTIGRTLPGLQYMISRIKNMGPPGGNTTCGCSVVNVLDRGRRSSIVRAQSAHQPPGGR